MFRNFLEPSDSTGLALDMLNQSGDELKLGTTVRTLEFKLIMGGRVEVLVEPVEGLESIVAEVTFVVTTIKCAFVC